MREAPLVDDLDRRVVCPRPKRPPVRALHVHADSSLACPAAASVLDHPLEPGGQVPRALVCEGDADLHPLLEGFAADQAQLAQVERHYRALAIAEEERALDG